MPPACDNPRFITTTRRTAMPRCARAGAPCRRTASGTFACREGQTLVLATAAAHPATENAAANSADPDRALVCGMSALSFVIPSEAMPSRSAQQPSRLSDP